MDIYEESWGGRNGTRWAVRLDGGPETTYARAQGLTLEEDDDEDVLAPVRSWTGRLTVLADSAAAAGRLMPRGAQESAATVTADGAADWRGFVRPETLTQSWPGRRTAATLTLQSRLATAGGKYLDAGKGRGFTTLGELLHECLALCGFSDSDSFAWPTRWQTTEGAGGLSVLRLQASRARFFADNQGGEDADGAEVDAADGAEKTPFEVMTTADVAIEAVMRFFGYSLREHAGGLVAVCPGWPTYERTTVGALATGAAAAETYAAATESVYGRGGGEGEVSYLQGRKRVTVRSELARLAGNLVPSVRCEGRKFVGSYNRELWSPWFPSVDDPSTRYHAKVYELRDRSGDAVFRAFSGEGALDPVDDLDSWKNAEGGLDNSGGWAGHPQRMGAFPCQLDAYRTNELHYGDVTPDGTQRDYEYAEGFLVNPYQFEGTSQGELWQAGRGAALTMRNRNAATWRGGAFVLNFGVTAYQLLPSHEPDPGPVSPAWNSLATVGFFLRLGDYLWTGEHFAPASEAPLIYWPVPLEDTEGKTWPAVAETENWKTIRMPYNGASGIIAELKDASGADLEVSGDMMALLYVIPTWQGREGVHPVQMLFFSDFSLEYREPDDEADAETAAASYAEGSDTRTIYRKTRHGFTADGYTAELQLSSRQAGASGSLSTLLTAAGRPVETLWDAEAGAAVQPERGLLGFLARYYDRIIERRVVTEPLLGGGQFAPESLYRFPDDGDGRQWTLLARSADHQAQTVRLTLISVDE